MKSVVSKYVSTHFDYQFYLRLDLVDTATPCKAFYFTYGNGQLYL